MRNFAFAQRMIGLAAVGCWILPTLVVGQFFPPPPTGPGYNTTTNETFAPTSAPTLEQGFNFTGECYDNTTLLFQEMLRANSFFEETYVICPNTRMNIGFLDNDLECCVDGMYSLFLRSRSTVMCGEDGKSSNNCTLYGGNTHIFFAGVFFGDQLAQDVRVMGLTFEGAEFLSGALGNRGDVSFIDCIWKNNAATGVFFIAYSIEDEESGRRLNKLLEDSGIDTDDPMQVAKHMMSREYMEEWVKIQMESAQQGELPGPGPIQEGHDRHLQAAFTMETNFENCLFENNRQGPTNLGGIPLLGIVNVIAPFNPTNLRNVTFRGNKYDGSDGSQNGYAVQSLGSPLSVIDCCLVENNFIGFGPVQVFANAEFEFDGNYADQDDLIFCDFAAISSAFVPESFADISCVFYDKLGCEPDAADVLPPTAAPTYALTMPSSANSWRKTGTATPVIAWVCMWLLMIHV